MLMGETPWNSKEFPYLVDVTAMAPSNTGILFEKRDLDDISTMHINHIDRSIQKRIVAGQRLE